jgi:uncharacterized protein
MEAGLPQKSSGKWNVQGIDLQGLKGYLSTRKEVAFAFLYGSYAKGAATMRSDVDIAVYFYPRERHPVQIEEEIFYPTESEIWGDLEQLLSGKDVELLVLNRVPAAVAASAIKGVPLLIRDWPLYLDFLENVTDMAEEFTEFIINQYKERVGIAKGDQS